MTSQRWCIYCGGHDRLYGNVCHGCLMLGQASRYNLPDPPPYRDVPPLKPEHIARLVVDETPEPSQRDWWRVGWAIAALCFLVLLAHLEPVCKP